MYDVQLVVLAKAPVPGRVKTRLCPALTPTQASDVARAALLDSLDVVAAVPVRRRVLALEGSSDGLVPTGFDVVGQRGQGLDERIAAAFSDVWAGLEVPILLVGMDTPQMTAAQLTGAVQHVATGRPVLGLAADGGWWAVGLPAPDEQVFAGVPMSRHDTGSRQLERMRARGLDPFMLPTLRDIDHVADLMAAAADLPASSRVASVVRHVLVGAA